MSGMKQIMVLDSKLVFKNSFTDTQIQEYSNTHFSVTEDAPRIGCYEWFEKERFDEAARELIAFAKRWKNKIGGDMIVVCRADDSEDAARVSGRYRLKKDIEFEECDINVSLRKTRAQPKVLTEDEKVMLCREYADEKHKLPSKNEVYKGFRIGAFYHTLSKNSTLFQQVAEVMEGK